MEEEKETAPASVPVPAPRSKHKPKPPPPVKLPVVSSAHPTKPDVPTKPKIGPKPSIAAKPSSATSPTKEANKEQETVLRRTRPLSIKVTNDGVHNKVASELASILGRPRSSSKGLLSPTSYSAATQLADTASNDVTTKSNGATPPVSPPAKSAPKPVPRPRQSVSSIDAVISPTTPTSAPTTPTPAPTTPEVVSQPALDTADKVTKPAKPRPSRPPPPSVKRPPPPQRPPSAPQQTPSTATPPSSSDNKAVNDIREDNSVGISTNGQATPANKKLEITVLGARPMSEVGFRDVKSQSLPSQLVADQVAVGNRLSDKTEQNISSSVQQVSSNSRAAATANVAIKTDSNSPTKNTCTPADRPSNGTSTRKPTIIRPGRRPGNTTHSDTDSLVTKDTANSPKSAQAQSTGSTPKPLVKSTPTPGTPASQRKQPPNSLPVKKDPWNQIAKGPGPTDNLAFSTGDTPPPKSQGLTLFTSLANQEDPTAAEDPDTLIDFVGKLPEGTTKPGGSPKPTRTIMDQSLENTLSDVLQPKSTTSPKADSTAEPDMFFHNVSTEPSQTTSKPSALQRIYEAKKAREEKQPDKYKHRPDCYVDKPNLDTGFWKPSAHSSDSDLSPKAGSMNGSSELKKSMTNDGTTKKGSLLVAYAAFAYKGTKPTDLSLKAGQEVKVIAKLDNEWLYGEADGKSGTFPALYVSVSDEDIEMLPMHKPSGTGSKSNSSAGVCGTALYDFTAEHDSELSLKAGDKIVNVEPVDDEWSMGKIANRSGIFPTSFVELCS